MLLKTLERFKSLPQVTKSMVALFWVYEFSQIITWSFLNIFVFLQTNSLFSLAAYNASMFTGVFLGFTVWGFIMSQFHVSMRLNYFRAFAIYVLSFVFLLIFPHTFWYLMAFGFLNGIGMGMFWLGVHAYEMIYTDNSNRDFYSSMVTIGSQIFGILAPFMATASFIFSEKVLNADPFTVLLWILPFVYFFAVPFIFKLPDYYPKKIAASEMKRLFCSKKIWATRLYYFFGDYDFMMRFIVVPFFALAALGTVVNIGVLETIIGALAILAVTFLSHVRHEGNRIQIMLYAVMGIIGAEMFLFFSDVHWIFFVIYSLLFVFIKPILRVSEHVVDLESVERIKSVDHDFYPGLLYRDFVLWIGRMSAIALVLFIAYLVQDNLMIGKITVGLIMFFLLVKWYTAKKVVEDRA